MKARTKVALGLLLCAPIAAPQFPGMPQIVLDPTTAADVMKDVAAMQQMLQLETTLRMTITNMEAAFKSGNWQAAMQDIAMGTAITSRVIGSGSNSATLGQLNHGIQLAQIALQESTMAIGHPTTANAMMMTEVALQQLDAQIKRDQLQAHLNYDAQVSGYLSANGTGIKPQSTAIANWSLK